MFKEKDMLLYKGQPAVVAAVEGGKAIVELPPKGKEPAERKSIREKDAALLAEGPVASLKAALGAQLPPFEVSPDEAADFFEGEEPSFAEVAELLWGKMPPECAWAAWQAFLRMPRFCCESPDSAARGKSRAEAEEEARAREEKLKKEKEKEAFCARLRNTAKNREGGIRLPDDAAFLQEVEALALGKSGRCASLLAAGLKESPESAHSVLIKCGWWNRKRNPWPERKGLRLSDAAADVAPPAEDDDAGREDFTRFLSFAIDNEWSDDPDDAVAFYGGRLWVHIADPVASVLPDSAADIEARARGATLYLPEGTFKMLKADALPLFALGLTEKSRALSFGIAFTETGAVKDVQVKKTFVAVRRMTYEEADAQKESAELFPLFEIARRNTRRREEAGAVSIEMPEARITLDAEKNIAFSPVFQTEAFAMVREMMLLAGEAAARFAFKHSIPFQYISQEQPSLPAKLPEGLAGEFAKRKGMKPRKVGVTPSDHAGLGLGMYSQVTSPLRRYGDLVSHQQLHRFIADEPMLSPDEMTERIAQGDAALRLCVQAERETRAHWAVNYLLDNPNWVGDAVILDAGQNAGLVLIPELGLEARCAIPAGAKPNGVIRVRAGKPDVPSLDPDIYPV